VPQSTQSPQSPPRSAPSSRKGLFRLAVALFLGCGKLACSEDPNDDANPFREDVVRCEDALAHLSTCCPDVKVPAGACTFSHYEQVCGGCSARKRGAPGKRDVWPVLSVAESQAIENERCSAVDCTKAAELVIRAHASETKGTLDCE
jgi:hypothetical protein